MNIMGRKRYVGGRVEQRLQGIRFFENRRQTMLKYEDIYKDCYYFGVTGLSINFKYSSSKHPLLNHLQGIFLYANAQKNY